MLKVSKTTTINQLAHDNGTNALSLSPSTNLNKLTKNSSRFFPDKDLSCHPLITGSLKTNQKTFTSSP
jgi:hypothetical protein